MRCDRHFSRVLARKGRLAGIQGKRWKLLFDDTVPGNGTYRYAVAALSSGYRTEAERQVTYTYTVRKT